MTNGLWIALGSIGAIVLMVSWPRMNRFEKQGTVGTIVLMGLIIFAVYTVFA